MATLTTLVAAAAVAAVAPGALAASAGHPASPAFTNPGAASPSLSLSVSPTGEAEVASVGKGGTLWFSAQFPGGAWHRTKVAGTGAANSGPSIFAEPNKAAFIAVQGAKHSLQFYSLSKGHWHHTQVAGPNTTFSAPSLAMGLLRPAIAVVGPSNSLLYYALTGKGWKKHVVNGKGTAFSAPSLVVRSFGQADFQDPAGQVDIAVQNGNHSLSYYNSTAHGWQNDVIGAGGTTYSAPSLIVRYGAFAGVIDIVAEGPVHSLWYYTTNGRPLSPGILLAGHGWVFAAPSLFQSTADPANQIELAYQGAAHSVFFEYYNPLSAHWQNDILAGASGQGYSAPSLFVRSSHPNGQDNIVIQGKNDTLLFFQAPKPSSPNNPPSFTGTEIAGPGSTFGG